MKEKQNGNYVSEICFLLVLCFFNEKEYMAYSIKISNKSFERLPLKVTM